MNEQNNWKDWEEVIRKDLAQFPIPLPKFTEELISSIKQILSSQAQQMKEKICEEERQRIMNRLLEMSRNTQSIELLQAFEQLEGEYLSAIESIEI